MGDILNLNANVIVILKNISQHCCLSIRETTILKSKDNCGHKYIFTEQFFAC